MKGLAVILSIIFVILIVLCFVLPAPKGGDGGTSAAPDRTTVLPPETSLQPTTAPIPTTTVPSTSVAPQETTSPVPDDADFVAAADFVPNLRVELAYATADNFTGQQIYAFSSCYLRYGTVTKLVDAAELLAQQGLGILIWDGYRPLYAQQKLWDICPDPNYVSKPGTGSQSHCRGIAVDITLYDINSGKILEMPSAFDDFSAKGDRDYSDCTQQAAENAVLLENVMVSCGFKPYSGEWWHYSDTQSYPIEENFDPANAG